MFRRFPCQFSVCGPIDTESDVSASDPGPVSRDMGIFSARPIPRDFVQHLAYVVGQAGILVRRNGWVNLPCKASHDSRMFSPGGPSLAAYEKCGPLLTASVTDPHLLNDEQATQESFVLPFQGTKTASGAHRLIHVPAENREYDSVTAFQAEAAEEVLSRGEKDMSPHSLVSSQEDASNATRHYAFDVLEKIYKTVYPGDTYNQPAEMKPKYHFILG
ncbi:hypothetical protein B0J13DRAFT_528969 [Dactylonectria estremocensis]|uniref:Uncharacterized protein n=1 Tax=Dactylonectria estremocensis TaxID=1079267 RepID=A0A9P9IUP5_9HYPO|nr:hypothetical protein B0J13DRAFT_528969 [Dactylonectria estremocensis]